MKSRNGKHVYFGDLHSHCNVGYGHGSLEDAYANAALQLDFVAVTPHAHWHDMPVDDPDLGDLVAYHRIGFKRTAEAWERVRQTAHEATVPGKFAAFLAYEWHSCTYGDHNVYFKNDLGEIFRSGSLEELRDEVLNLRQQGGDAFLIPHHIGYRSGSRGINWDHFSSEFSPVAEAMSMHGCAESPEAPFPYHHTMGPRDWQSMYQFGLERGNVVGIIGSTDHHSAHPGSYGHGGLAVWADGLTRDNVFEAIESRRCYAISGDKIALDFSVNGVEMGALAEPNPSRTIQVEVEGGSAIDYVEVLHNNTVVHRWNGKRTSDGEPFSGALKTHFEVGWGEVGTNVDWDVSLEVRGGELVGVDPRFRGHSIVAPQRGEEETYQFSAWERIGPSGVRFTTRTWGNMNTATPGMQGLGLEVKGDGSTLISAQINGQTTDVSLASLLIGPRTGYLGGFLSPAFSFSRAVPAAESNAKFEIEHSASSEFRDWYYVRVRQHNGQWAWSSPLWVEPTT
jgi:hypothetical protein